MPSFLIAYKRARTRARGFRPGLTAAAPALLVIDIQNTYLEEKEMPEETARAGAPSSSAGVGRLSRVEADDATVSVVGDAGERQRDRGTELKSFQNPEKLIV